MSADQTTFNRHKRGKLGKRLIFLTALLFVSVIVIVIYLSISKEKNTSQEYNTNLDLIYDTQKPILIERDGLYGYIDINGKELVSPHYSEATEFFGDYAYVAVQNTSDFSYDIFIIDKTGESVLEPESASLDAQNGVWIIDDRLHDATLKQISSDGINIISNLSNGYYKYFDDESKKYGLMSSAGDILYPCGVDDCDIDIQTVSPALKDKYALVSGKTILDLTSNKRPLRTVSVLEIGDKDMVNMGDNIFMVGMDTAQQKSIYLANDKIAYETSSNAYLSMYDPIKSTLLMDFGSEYKYVNIVDNNTSSTAPNDTPLSITSSEMANYHINTCASNNAEKSLKRNGEEVFSCGRYIFYRVLPSELYDYIKHTYGKDIILTVDTQNKSHLVDLKTMETVFSFDSPDVQFDTSTFIIAVAKDEIIAYNVVSNKSKVFTGASVNSVTSNSISIVKQEEISYYDANLELIYSYSR
jgi:hypothetical protein